MSRRVLQLRKLLESSASVEGGWDRLLGGRETRAYRDLLGYVASKLVLAGAEPESVISYLGELFTEHGAELVDLRDALVSLQEDREIEASAGDGEKSGIRVSRRAGEPQLWRKTRDGKAYGCWYVTVDKTDVNLNTKSAEIARGRLADAMKGKRKGWPSDAELAARAMELPAAGAPTPSPPAPESSAGAPAAAPVVPDGVIPPAAPTVAQDLPRPALPPVQDEQEARAEAEATNAAAAETASEAANDNAGAAGGAGPAFALGADAIRGMLAQGAHAIVELQLGLQAWLVFKRTGKIAPPVDPNSPIRQWAADAWVAQFEQWFPNMDQVPPWILAVGLPAMALPVQFMAAQPPPPEQQQNRPAGAPPPTEAATSQPEQAAA